MPRGSSPNGATYTVPDMSDEARYLTDRGDGRHVTTMGFCQHLLRNTSGPLAYRPGLDDAGFAAWRQRVRDKLAELLALAPELIAPGPAPDPPPVRLWSERREGYRLEKWETYPEPESVVPLLMLVPDTVDAARPGPAVMCFPGSASSKELLAGEPELRPEQPPNRHPVPNRMAWYYAKAGLVAVALDNPGIGELDLLPAGVPPNSGRVKLTAQLIRLGRSYVGADGVAEAARAGVASLAAVRRCRAGGGERPFPRHGAGDVHGRARPEPGRAGVQRLSLSRPPAARSARAAAGRAVARRGPAVARGARNVQVVRLSRPAELAGRPPANHDRRRCQAAPGPGPRRVPGTRLQPSPGDPPTTHATPMPPPGCTTTTRSRKG